MVYKRRRSLILILIFGFRISDRTLVPESRHQMGQVGIAAELLEASVLAGQRSGRVPRS